MVDIPPNLYSAYSVWYCIGTLASYKFHLLISNLSNPTTMSSLGVFGSRFNSSCLVIPVKSTISTNLDFLGILRYWFLEEFHIWYFRSIWFDLLWFWLLHETEVGPTLYRILAMPKVTYYIASVSGTSTWLSASHFFVPNFWDLDLLFPYDHIIIHGITRRTYLYHCLFCFISHLTLRIVIVRLMLTGSIICVCAAVTLSNVFKYNLKIYGLLLKS